MPAGRDEETVASQSLPIVQLKRVTCVVTACGDRPHAEKNFDPVMSQSVSECLSERFGFAREKILATLYQNYITAESPDGLRHLDSHCAPSEHDQATRHRLHAGHFAVSPDAV